uniref:Uncharacterized protein n=1 Tax=Caenorhabditis japonica TaxID=281687 RepID=A0A8R1DE29_CAEJA
MVTSESRECIVSPSVIDMNNYNQRSFDFDDEPHAVKLDLEENRPKGGRRDIKPISEHTLNMFACLTAAVIGTLAVIGLIITVFVLALK